ncbi:Arrestin domain-containing protein 3 [Bagarius yarrelli]|uniref:Arrestin domain-containing protein 3 n=1 Tax=Bagarius yarrelli TaxID=175774 RepID=A0A556U5S6_BAGYA|nr:Arrestin domain-containing protein 3 [Bagarius yarrelli]
MSFLSFRRFAVELDAPGEAVYSSGETVSGKVVLELHRPMDIRALKVQGRGVASAHWLEHRGVGVNTVYNDYTSKITYFRKRQHLIPASDFEHAQSACFSPRTCKYQSSGTVRSAQPVCASFTPSDVY